MGHRRCRIVAVCDVNANRLAEAKGIVDKHYGDTGCATHSDYREILARGDIDAVSIATPDAWHVLQSVEAARAGKDIFLEKPLGLSVKDDLALRDAIRRYERVFQFGTQQRSDRNFGFACELVQNGRIGRLRTITAATPASRSVGRVSIACTRLARLGDVDRPGPVDALPPRDCRQLRRVGPHEQLLARLDHDLGYSPCGHRPVGQRRGCHRSC